MAERLLYRRERSVDALVYRRSGLPSTPSGRNCLFTRGSFTRVGDSWRGSGMKYPWMRCAWGSSMLLRAISSAKVSLNTPRLATRSTIREVLLVTEARSLRGMSACPSREGARAGRARPGWADTNWGVTMRLPGTDRARLDVFALPDLFLEPDRDLDREVREPDPERERLPATVEGDLRDLLDRLGGGREEARRGVRGADGVPGVLGVVGISLGV